ncbi:MAG: AEC family transporter [Armatimonadota bacterium]|nr:AEC family transporter [Armatimonadota bacterium]MDR5696950.1 AEC family transporter [Armatimonadota bacterium]
MFLVNVIAPVLLLIGAGFALGKRRAVEVSSLSSVAMYLFTPALVLDSLLRYPWGEGDGRALIAFALVHLLLLLIVGLGTAAALRLRGAERSSFLLPVVMYNAGNYGLPVCLFAFGEQGFRLAVFVFVANATAGAILGGLIAAWGVAGGLRRAVGSVLRLPLLYASVGAGLASAAGWTLPDALARSVAVLGAGAIPLLLVTLGIQLSQAESVRYSPELLAVGILRLGVAPLMAIGVAAAMNLTGLARSVAIVQSAMPAAVNAFLFAAEFRCRPAFVASAVFATTAASFVTVTAVLRLLVG